MNEESEKSVSALYDLIIVEIIKEAGGNEQDMADSIDSPDMLREFGEMMIFAGATQTEVNYES